MIEVPKERNVEHGIRRAVEVIERAMGSNGAGKLRLRFLRALLFDGGHHGSRAFQCAVVDCTSLPTCFGQYESEENPIAFSCDTHCGHGNEDGRCDPVGDVL